MKNLEQTNSLAQENAANHSCIPGWKRILDVACILIIAPALVPIMLLISAAIKIVSSGPVLFKQERVGYRGRRFICLKFRTMKVNADTGVHQGYLRQLMKSNDPMVKLDSAGDKRLIRGGLFLRSLGLDELPQIINVLCGEMSLVGPRPCLPYEYESYEPRHCERFETVPGLTGLWQVSGKNRTTFEEMIALDINYARNKSLLMDVKILLKTTPAIMTQVGDTGRRRKTAQQAITFEGVNTSQSIGHQS